MLRSATVFLTATAIVVIAALVVATILGTLGSVVPFVLGVLVGAVIGGGAVMAGRNREQYLGGAASEAVVGWQEFHRELARSRRFGRSFGLVRFSGPDSGDGPSPHLRDRVAAHARRNDRFWIDGRDLFALLPEADADAVASAIARAQAQARGALGTAVVAVFPTSGITSGALIATLYEEQGGPVAIPSRSTLVASVANPDADGDAGMAETAT